jgi:hypothetical protein
MATEATAGDWYAEARRRATSAGRRRRASKASAEWPQLAPPVALSDGPLGAVQAADREMGRQTALRARAVAEFAASRPATADRAQGEPGAMSPERWAARPANLRPVSEWAARELVVALSISVEAAEALLTRSLDLVHRLPGTLAALEAGALHPGHLWSMLDKVAPIEDPLIRAEVEAELLRWAAGRVVTPAQMGAKARREVAQRDVRAAARRLEKALKERGVHFRPHDVDGMATVTVVATMPEAQALYQALIACAEALDEDDDPRTRGQKMVDCLLDLVLRPGESDLPPVQVLLTVVASIATLAGGDAPAEIDGQAVPAEMARQFLAALTASGGRAPASVDTQQEQPADPVPWQEQEQEDLERWWAEMERRVLAGELVDPDPEPCPHPTSGNPVDPAPDPDLWLDGHWVEPPDTLWPAPCDDPPPEWLLREPPSWSIDDPPQPPCPRLEDSAPSPFAVVSPEADPPGTSSATPPGALSAAGAEPRSSDEEQSNGPGWWATADRAVDEAGHAMSRARQALAHAERMVRTAAAADAADEDACQAGPGGRLTGADDALAALRSATDVQRELLTDLLASTGGGGLVERPRIALTDALSGTLLALTDLPALRRAGSCGRAACRRDAAGCRHDLADRPGLGPPGPTNAYRPSAELERWVRARDRRCRFPGCRRRVPRGGELDHNLRYPLGPTSSENLVGYCTADHRGKHQAPGWEHRLEPDGTLTVTTPTGLVAVTTPPSY